MDYSKSLILHRNGKTWKQVSSPSPASSSYLFGVAAASARNGWAAGATYHNGRSRTLIMHWNGTRRPRRDRSWHVP